MYESFSYFTPELGKFTISGTVDEVAQQYQQFTMRHKVKVLDHNNFLKACNSLRRIYR